MNFQTIYIIQDQNIEQNVEFLKNNSCLIKFAGGTGKTYQLVQFCKKHQDEVIVFSTTNIALDSIRKQGIQNVFTFASFFNEHYQQKKLNQYKNIIVDGISMVELKYIKKIFQVKVELDKIIHFYGDFNQYKPVKNGYYDYFNNQAFRSILDYYLLELINKEQSARYGSQTYQILHDLIQTKQYNNPLSKTFQISEEDKEQLDCIDEEFILKNKPDILTPLSECPQQSLTNLGRKQIKQFYKITMIIIKILILLLVVCISVKSILRSLQLTII